MGEWQAGRRIQVFKGEENKVIFTPQQYNSFQLEKIKWFKSLGQCVLTTEQSDSSIHSHMSTNENVVCLFYPCNVSNHLDYLQRWCLLKRDPCVIPQMQKIIDLLLWRSFQVYVKEEAVKTDKVTQVKTEPRFDERWWELEATLAADSNASSSFLAHRSHWQCERAESKLGQIHHR